MPGPPSLYNGEVEVSETSVKLVPVGTEITGFVAAAEFRIEPSRKTQIPKTPAV